MRWKRTQTFEVMVAMGTVVLIAALGLALLLFASHMPGTVSCDHGYRPAGMVCDPVTPTPGVDGPTY